ncbi:MAG: cysteine--tRNA ligase [Candidatus Uhrbacteria bacterium]
MEIKLHNSLTRKTAPFVPISPGHVGMYSCGPTVYWFAHIGNMRAFLFSDILRRALEYNGFDVTLVMNVTDVGHLVGDVDDGEDKMIVAMLREGKSGYQIAEFYAQAFFADLAALNIKPANVYPRATEHIPEQIEMVQALERKGFTYRTSDGIYFDTAKLPSYGRLSGQKSEDKKAGARVDMAEKLNATDFALWKFSPEDMEREMEWESPWGIGFPGWHIECSAMSKKYLGLPFDIHTGGIDHIPVHHENELAQAMGSDGVLEANVWMHNDFITVDGGRMAKSLGNIYTIANLVEKGFDPIAYRYFVLGSHYRSKLNFTWEAMEGAQNALNKLREIVRDYPSVVPQVPPPDRQEGTGVVDEPYASRFLAAINEDLNTPAALAVVWDLVNDATVDDAMKASTLLRFDEVLGLRLSDYLGKQLDVPADVTSLVAQREEARLSKNWGESDRLRDEIATRGFVVKDTPQGPKISLA